MPLRHRRNAIRVRRLAAAMAVAAAFGACTPAAFRPPSAMGGAGVKLPRLAAWGALPADTIVAQQPAMGFSALAPLADDHFLAATDNGYEAIERSHAFELRLYTLAMVRATEGRGAGRLRVDAFVRLRDPSRLVPFAIVNEFTEDRILTGADFDIESMQRGADGTLWLGDEYGPYVLHVRATGELIDPPIALPEFDAAGAPIEGRELWSPENPGLDRGVLRVLNAFRARGDRLGAVAPPTVSPPAESVGPGRPFDVAMLTAAGFPVVPYTVNDPREMEDLLRQGVAGIITDRPDVLRDVAAAAAHDRPLDRQGHRGARDLRPENTLPSMEAALDAAVTTLETDIGVTRDGTPVLDHEPFVQAATCRPSARAGAYAAPHEVCLQDIDFRTLQTTFLCDKTPRGPLQSADASASPAASAFARSGAIPSPYALPSLAQLFAFVDFYRGYYEHGPGRRHPEAAARALTATQVRFSLEIKVGTQAEPRTMTLAPAPFTAIVGAAVLTHGLERRTSLQSFDFRVLACAQEAFPSLRTVFLFGQGPAPGGRAALAGAPWLRPENAPPHATRVARSGGFEGMALSMDGKTLYPMLEQPLAGEPKGVLDIFELDTTTKRYTKRRARYRLSPRATSASDFVLVDAARGLVVERDATEGDPNGWKRVYSIELGRDGAEVSKALVVDLMAIGDPRGLGPHAAPGDVGLGRVFQMPFETIESVVFLGGSRIAVMNDNNYPSSVGRHRGSHRPDDTELVLIDVGRPLNGR